MALAQLTDEQTRTWTREQKDRWWFENVYRGDLPQLTLRSMGEYVPISYLTWVLPRPDLPAILVAPSREPVRL